MEYTSVHQLSTQITFLKRYSSITRPTSDLSDVQSTFVEFDEPDLDLKKNSTPQLDEAITLIVSQWPDDACRLLESVGPHLLIETLEDKIKNSATLNSAQLLPTIKILASHYQSTGNLTKATDLLMTWLQGQVSKDLDIKKAKPAQSHTEL